MLTARPERLKRGKKREKEKEGDAFKKGTVGGCDKELSVCLSVCLNARLFNYTVSPETERGLDTDFLPFPPHAVQVFRQRPFFRPRMHGEQAASAAATAATLR